MNCPDCDKQIHDSVCSCGWIQPGSAKVTFRSTEHEMPGNGITREQLGLTLYTAIELVGGIKQLRRYRGLMALHVLPKTNEYKVKEAKLIEQLKSALVALKPDDVTELLNEYPWVATL